jgi:bile acid:Na+ symporter, BASS family
MRIFHFIENYFWVFLITGLLMGLIYPVYNDFLMSMLKPLLMTMLFLVFLKTNLFHILKQVRDYRLMIYLVVSYMIIIPFVFFQASNLFNREFAIAILLLTAMPAAVASPSLTDIVKGNIALSASIAIITSLIAPFTVPLLFSFIKHENLSMDPWQMFSDLAILVFVPLILSLIVKKIAPAVINRAKNKFTAVNILIICILIFTAMGSQRDLILRDTISIIWKVGFLYLVYIMLHITGYLIGFNQDKESKVAITIGAAYKNNGLAIVLAAIHFEPSILVLMVLSEFPWNTLLAPFRRVMRYL